MSIVVLAGGIGGAKFIEGLYAVMNPDKLHVIINTGDDRDFFGLYVSPDIDIITYTLAGIVHKKNRWGLARDTYHTLHQIEKFYGPQWFNLGDKDLATHIYRTDLLHRGIPLSKITQDIAIQMGVHAHLHPMANQAVPTIIETNIGPLDFESYYVQHHCQPNITKIYSKNSELARLPVEFTELFRNAEKIIIGPSNPFTSIFPILSIPGMRVLVQQFMSKIIGISPIINGQAIKGPLIQMMHNLKKVPSSLGIAQLYREILSVFIIDKKDADLLKSIHQLGIRCETTDILLNNYTKKKNLAQFVLQLELKT
jgi:LPPG:FO 2-phospho-L-lactate transferase